MTPPKIESTPRTADVTRRRCFRIIGAGLLGGLAAFVAGKRGLTTRPGRGCDQGRGCPICPDLAACSLPQAEDARREVPRRETRN